MSGPRDQMHNIIKLSIQGINPLSWILGENIAQVITTTRLFRAASKNSIVRKLQFRYLFGCSSKYFWKHHRQVIYNYPPLFSNHYRLGGKYTLSTGA